jgi:hypothetical protein
MAGEISASIKEIWEEVLGVPVTDDTDFFVAGGHSFLAARILAGVERATGYRPTLRSLFDNPRLADFVAVVDAERRQAEPSLMARP